MSSVACYKCGAYPNHPMKTLDVLKLIKCEDCGKIACPHHRKGIVGGQCAECGSHRSSIAAFRSGGKGKGGGINTGGASAAASSGTTATSGAGNLSISKNTLESMKSFRQQTAEEIAERKKQEAKDAKLAKMSEQERQRQQELEDAVKKILGDKNYVKPATAAMSINATSLAAAAAIGLGKALGATGANQQNDELNNPNIQVSNEDQYKKDKNKKTEDSDEEEDNKKDIFSIASSVTPTESFDKKKKTKKKEDGSDDEELELNISRTVINKTNKVNICLHDEFHVCSDKNINLEQLLNLKKEFDEGFKENINDLIELDRSEVVIKNSLKVFIPLDGFDKFLNIDNTELEENGLSLITGILGQKLDFTSIEYLDQFALLIKDKPYISGLYTSFVKNENFDIEEQKQVALKLIDIAQENNKTCYLGLQEQDISLWQEIFDEYDLSEISFVYTDLINDEQIFNFIKQNNIKFMLRPDINLEEYLPLIADYPNICFGSGFKKCLPENTNFDCSKPEILLDLIKNLANIDKNLAKQLLNIT